jgi:predicted metal-binding membrane protein
VLRSPSSHCSRVVIVVVLFSHGVELFAFYRARCLVQCRASFTWVARCSRAPFARVALVVGVLFVRRSLVSRVIRTRY